MSAAPQPVLELVDRFRRNRDRYQRSEYGEAQTRQEFINPLFQALGWDVYNERGTAPQYAEVIHEATLRDRGGVKAPDYAFRIGTDSKFFVEAKKPAVNIYDDIGPAYQLRRYAWTAKMPLSILTDFAELSVYDCRYRPSASDSAATARTIYMTYDEYAERWEEIDEIFGHEAVWGGDFDRYAESTKAKRGTTEVDEAFLAEIEEWRKLLARNMALRNPSLTVRQLNYAVQKTIDRIIFLRICEDRDIEPYGQLRDAVAATTGGDGVAYSRLLEIFRRADGRYNSGLFHFQAERGREETPDDLTPGLAVDDKVLADIVDGLYYPDSPYAFDVLSVDILGNVYEQFLGSVIRLTPAHRARVEQKPEVRKAGGVYYTPKYIVDYIVEHTVGELVKDKTPGQIAGQGSGQPLRILDPACGSGSFLLGAYQYLLDYHLDWYLDNPLPSERQRDELCPGPGGAMRLTTAKKKEILLNNIYGVDIDTQAVEVTKLSLLLKVLEGESRETLQLELLPERALPDLAGNIKCGNSLIGTDFFEGRQRAMFDDEELYRVNPFDWESEFPEALAAGGFDAVIGNPPYIRIQNLKEFAPTEVEFYKGRYVAASKGNYDIYVVFVEKGLSLLNERGWLGFIVPSKFITTDYGESIRGILSSPSVLSRIVDFGHEQVFHDATTYTCLLFLDRSKPDQVLYLRTDPADLPSSDHRTKTLPSSSLSDDVWILDQESNQLMTRLDRLGERLLDLPALMSRGSSSGADTVFCLKVGDGELTTRSGEPVSIEDDILRTPLFARDFGRYQFGPTGSQRIIFPYKVYADKYELVSEAELHERFPKAYAYLRRNRSTLEKRKQYKEWYGFSAPRNLNVHDGADLLVPLLANRGLASPMGAQAPAYCVMASAGFSVSIVRPNPLSALYVLALVNSTVLFWYLRQISNKFRGGWVTCTKQYFGQLPIRTIDWDDPADVARHDELVALVERMLALHEDLAAAKVPSRKTMLERQIAATDRQIDRLVYALYDLTDEEIAIVEEGVGS